MATASSDARAAMRRARLADFTIAAELYRSTAGGVYRAKHRPSGRTVVLKERLLAAGGGDGGNEVKLFERLPSHPNIVEYLGCFETPPDRLHLVFAWASQGDLQALLRQQRAAGRYLSERQVLQWFVPIAEGVLHLHRHGIVHRDIKSLNILVDNGVPKLCDLGVSRHRSQQTIEMKSFCGTPAYLSPEMAAAQPYTEKTDVWGLGVVLYELLALRLPFSGANLMEISAQIAKGRFAPLPPHVGAPLTSLVRGMLALDASARPAVAEVLARASAAHAELLEIRAARQRAKEEEERRRDGAAAAAAAAAAPRPPYAAAAAEPTGGPGADGGRRDDRPARRRRAARVGARRRAVVGAEPARRRRAAADGLRQRGGAFHGELGSGAAAGSAPPRAVGARRLAAVDRAAELAREHVLSGEHRDQLRRRVCAPGRRAARRRRRRPERARGAGVRPRAADRRAVRVERARDAVGRGGDAARAGRPRQPLDPLHLRRAAAAADDARPRRRARAAADRRPARREAGGRGSAHRIFR